VDKQRRYLISAAILTACVCIAVSVLALMPSGPGVTKANFDRVEVGMTFDEVEAILGTQVSALAGGEGVSVWWRDDGAAVFVRFNFVDGKVRDKEFRASDRPRQTPSLAAPAKVSSPIVPIPSRSETIAHAITLKSPDPA
jgi:hypothetical protein